MNRIISIALALLLVGIFWAPTSSQTSDKITLEFSEDNPDSLVELEENEVDRDSRRSRDTVPARATSSALGKTL